MRLTIISFPVCKIPIYVSIALLSFLVKVSAAPPKPIRPPARGLSVAEHPKAPFWLAKRKIYRRITQGREALVSVSVSKGSSKKKPHLMRMSGAVLINSTRSVAYESLKDFNNLTKMTSVIKEVRFNPKRQQLFLHCLAFDFHARLLSKVEFREDDKKGVSQIRFHVIAGVFDGMTGSFQFRDHGRGKTLMSLYSEYEYDKLKIPKFFVEFGLEVILQKMAVRIRSFTEGQRKKSPKI